VKKRTDNYVMTVDPMSVTDAEKVSALRKTISAMNKVERKRVARKLQYSGVRENPIVWRVCLKGRLGKNNPAAAKYKDQWIQSIKLEDATRIDVYVQRRWY
jgi:hypothetical protein